MINPDAVVALPRAGLIVPERVDAVFRGHRPQGIGEAETQKGAEAVPGLVCHDFWETTSTPADNTGNEDAADRPVHLEPPANGSIFRIVDFPPDGKIDEQVEL